MYPPEVVKLAESIRALIKVEVQGVEETAYLGWRTINFRVDGQQFAYLGLQPGYVHFGFDKGVLLDDPERLLGGQAKIARYVRIHSPKKVNKAAIRGLVQDAVRLNALTPKAARGSEKHSGKRQPR